MASLAKGSSRLTGALKSDDTFYMAQALREMGVQIIEPDDVTFIVNSDGTLKEPSGPIFLGNAGTAMRFLTAAAILIEGSIVVDGDENMRRRPIAPLVKALRSLGVDITADTGCPPVAIRGKGDIKSNHIIIDAALSSQYASALLMVSACQSQSTDLELSSAAIEALGASGYIDITINTMRSFGAFVEQTSPSTWRVSPTGYTATNFAIEPDASAATYFWAAEALTKGSINLGLSTVSLTQPDASAYALIACFPNLPAVINGSQIQDAIPTLAVLAAFNQTPVRFTGIANLRVKECDRIAALACELSKIVPGLAYEDGDDLIINPNLNLIDQALPARINTYCDHRIAMSLALAGLKLNGITILDPDCVSKTYPGYWKALRAVGVEFVEDIN